MAKATKLVKTVLERYGLDPDTSCWDCHGTLVVYHKACQIIAMQAGIEFSMPQIVQSDPVKGIVIILVEGSMTADDGTRRVMWSFGEATPQNNKNSYPYAMAEKRAKDRVTLALAGIHGYVYSEIEADDFQKGAAPAPPAETVPEAKPEPEKVEPVDSEGDSLIKWIEELNTSLMTAGCENKEDADRVCVWLWEGEVDGVDECRATNEKARDTIYKMDSKLDDGINRNEFITESKAYS